MQSPANYIHLNFDNQKPEEIYSYIHKNRKQFNIKTSEHCDELLCRIFKDHHKIDIKSIKDALDRGSNQTKFRQKLIERFGECIISEIHHSSCQASHINDLSEESNNYDVDNGLLLSPTLHKEFDQLKWCINPDTYCVEIHNKYKNYKLGITNYNGKNLKEIIGNYPNRKYLIEKYNRFINQ
jgi:hypothetical protein